MAVLLYFLHKAVWVNTYHYHEYAIYEYYTISLHLRNDLGAGPLALTVAEIGDFSRSYGTYIGDLTVGSTLHCISVYLHISKLAKRNCDTTSKRFNCFRAVMRKLNL